MESRGIPNSPVGCKVHTDSGQKANKQASKQSKQAEQGIRQAGKQACKHASKQTSKANQQANSLFRTLAGHDIDIYDAEHAKG